ncbi:MAG: hypothetical protein Q4G26_16425, partial [Paracoccus sp. (in: a-proteobacteria)]|nr:hypothetical protein [Paracoccus sp. (in: a-proteobacteria)]
MTRAATLLMCLLALAFVVSGMIFAVTPAPIAELPGQIAARAVHADPDGLATIYLRPQQPAMWLMVAALWTVVLLFGARREWRGAAARRDLDLA